MLRALQRSPWAGSVLLFVAAAGLLQLDLGQPPEFDELYHVLAAQGWLQTGQLSIAEGVYERVALFTHLIARLFSIFGPSLEVARQPSVIACALLVALTFQWCWRHVGPAAAWISAILLLLSPFLIDIAQFVRFYGLQALGFFIAAIAGYALLDQNRTAYGRTALAVIALLSLGIAIYLQPVTVVGAIGIGLWGSVIVVTAWLKNAGSALPLRLAILAGITLVGIALLAAFLTTEPGAYLIHKYRWSPDWNKAAQGQFVFYHVWLVLYYPSLWTFFPLLLIVAIGHRPRPASFAATLFVTAFLLHSFAAVKDLRYIFYAMPFLFILWGTAIAFLFERIMRFIREQLDVTGRRLPRRLEKILRPAFWLGLAVFLVLANTANVRTATMLAGITIPPENPHTRWQEARTFLEPWLKSADIVITSSELHALYYLDRYDLLFSHSRLQEVGNTQLARDHRTGRPVIDDREILQEIIECYSSGLIVSSAFRWRNRSQFDDQTADLIINLTDRLELPAKSQIVAFAWDHGASFKGDRDCLAIEE